MTAEPIRRPTTASTAASHACTVLGHFGLPEACGVMSVMGGVAVIAGATLFIFVKM